MSDSNYIYTKHPAHAHLLSSRSSTYPLTFLESCANQQLVRAHDTTTSHAIYDTLLPSEQPEHTQSVQPGTTPTLVPCAKSHDPDFLALLSEAFAQTFKVATESVITQTNDYQNLEVNQTKMAQEVLQSTLKSLQDEKNDIEASSSLAASQKRASHIHNIFSKISTGVMIAFGVATVVGWIGSMILDPETIPASARAGIWLTLRVGRMLSAVVIASPMLAKGIIAKQDTAPALAALAEKEAEIGTSSSNMQLMNMSWRCFWQQVKQESGILSDGTEFTGKITELFNDTVTSYRSISQGLASSV